MQRQWHDNCSYELSDHEVTFPLANNFLMADCGLNQSLQKLELDPSVKFSAIP